MLIASISRAFFLLGPQTYSLPIISFKVIINFIKRIYFYGRISFTLQKHPIKPNFANLTDCLLNLSKEFFK